MQTFVLSASLRPASFMSTLPDPIQCPGCTYLRGQAVVAHAQFTMDRSRQEVALLDARALQARAQSSTTLGLREPSAPSVPPSYRPADSVATLSSAVGLAEESVSRAEAELCSVRCACLPCCGLPLRCDLHRG